MGNPKHVWLLWGGKFYADGGLLKIFRTKKAAQKHCRDDGFRGRDKWFEDPERKTWVSSPGCQSGKVVTGAWRRISKRDIEGLEEVLTGEDQ